MRRTPHFLVVAESMAQFTALLGLSCLRNAGPLVVVQPVKRKLLAAIGCPRALSFTPSDQFGAVESMVSLRSWRAVIGIHCSSRLKMESRRLLFRRSVAAHMAIRLPTQRRSL